MKLFNQSGVEDTANGNDYISDNSKTDKGFIYIIRDNIYPEFFKIGKTENLKTRLAAYHTNRPFPSAWVHVISREFKDVDYVEDRILNVMYAHIPATTFKKEWFLIEHLDLAIRCVSEAETVFE